MTKRGMQRGATYEIRQLRLHIYNLLRLASYEPVMSIERRHYKAVAKRWYNEVLQAEKIERNRSQ